MRLMQRVKTLSGSKEQKKIRLTAISNLKINDMLTSYTHTRNENKLANRCPHRGTIENFTRMQTWAIVVNWILGDELKYLTTYSHFVYTYKISSRYQDSNNRREIHRGFFRSHI